MQNGIIYFAPDFFVYYNLWIMVFLLTILTETAEKYKVLIKIKISSFNIVKNLVYYNIMDFCNKQIFLFEYILKRYVIFISLRR